jgi:hypothetical protein
MSQVRSSQAEHDLMVQMLARGLAAAGHGNVRAHVEGWDPPGEIAWRGVGRGHVPDVTATGEGFELYEIETADSIEHPHTAEQWESFNAFARRNNLLFTVVVPKGSRPLVEKRLNELEVTAAVLELERRRRPDREGKLLPAGFDRRRNAAAQASAQSATVSA